MPLTWGRLPCNFRQRQIRSRQLLTCPLSNFCKKALLYTWSHAPMPSIGKIVVNGFASASALIAWSVPPGRARVKRANWKKAHVASTAFPTNVPGQNRLLVGPIRLAPLIQILVVDARASPGPTRTTSRPSLLQRCHALALLCASHATRQPNIDANVLGENVDNSSTWEFLPRTTQTGPLHPTVPNFLVGPREGWRWLLFFWLHFGPHCSLVEFRLHDLAPM